MLKTIVLNISMALIVISGFCLAEENEVVSKEIYSVFEKSNTSAILIVKMSCKNISGTPIWLECFFKNTTNTDIIYVHQTSYRDFSIQIFDNNNNEIVLTNFGKHQIPANELGYTKLLINKLKPNHYFSTKYNLIRFFDLTVAGKYTLLISRKYKISGKEQKIEVKIPFTIEEYYPVQPKIESIENIK